MLGLLSRILTVAGKRFLPYASLNPLRLPPDAARRPPFKGGWEVRKVTADNCSTRFNTVSLSLVE